MKFHANAAARGAQLSSLPFKIPQITLLNKNKLADPPEKDKKAKRCKEDANLLIGMAIKQMKQGGPQAPAGDGCSDKGQKGPDVGQAHPPAMNQMFF